jgi:DNA invertase Pin-like site-specific DNA recombinase
VLVATPRLLSAETGPFSSRFPLYIRPHQIRWTSIPAGRLIANVLASVASYETEVRAERIAAGKAAKAAKIEATIKAGGTPPVVNKGGRPKGIPNKVTPTVAGMILKMKQEKKKVAMIARELNLSRQTVYEVLRRA